MIFPRRTTNRALRTRLRTGAILVLLGGLSWGAYCGYRYLEYDSYCVRWREWMQWPDRAMREHGLTPEAMAHGLRECEREGSSWSWMGLHGAWAIALGVAALLAVPKPTRPDDVPSGQP